MARVIPFYIPPRYRKQEKWTPPQLRGRVLAFRRLVPKLSDHEWRILGLRGPVSRHFKIPS